MKIEGKHLPPEFGSGNPRDSSLNCVGLLVPVAKR